jgi:hypothetical protein
MDDGIEDLAYQEAIRGISEQREALGSLRTRAGILLTASSIVTSFLGSLALRRGEVSLAGWFAMGFFIISMGTALWVLLPWPLRRPKTRAYNSRRKVGGA